MTTTLIQRVRSRQLNGWLTHWSFRHREGNGRSAAVAAIRYQTQGSKLGAMKLSLAPLVVDRLQLPVLMALQSFNLTVDRSPRQPILNDCFEHWRTGVLDPEGPFRVSGPTSVVQTTSVVTLSASKVRLRLRSGLANSSFGSPVVLQHVAKMPLASSSNCVGPKLKRLLG